MSMMYCKRHDQRYDSDRVQECAACENEDIDELKAEFAALAVKAETGEQHAHLCWLSRRIDQLSI